MGSITEYEDLELYMETVQGVKGATFNTSDLEWSPYLFNDSFVDQIRNLMKPQRHAVLQTVVQALKSYYLPVAICFGLVTNLSIFIVLRRTTLKQLSMVYYLLGQCVSDSGFLLATGLFWLPHYKVNIITTEGICHLASYTMYVCNFMSVWLLVCLLMERSVVMVTVEQPVKNGARGRAKWITILLTFSVFIAYSVVLWTYGVSEIFIAEPVRMCGPLRKYYYIVSIFHILDTIITAMLPYSLLLLVSVFLLLRLLFAAKNLQTITVYDRHTRHLRMRVAGQLQLTFAFLLVALVTWALNMPSQWLRVRTLMVHFKSGRQEMTSAERTWEELYRQIYYTSFGIKFLIYLLVSSHFRRALYHWLCSICKHTEDAQPTDV